MGVKSMMATILALSPMLDSNINAPHRIMSHDPSKKKCANPSCKKRTISSEFCCLSCAAMSKRKDSAE